MKIQARVENTAIDAITGNARISLVTTDNSCVPLLPMITGKELTVAFSDQKKRSLNANAYAWVLIDKLAEKLSTNGAVMTKTDVYRHAIQEIGGVSEVGCFLSKAVPTLKRVWEKQGIGWLCVEAEEPSKLPNCTNVFLYYGSSSYDAKQMSRLLDFLIQECKQQGIETDTPDKIAKMKSLWGEAYEKHNAE